MSLVLDNEPLSTTCNSYVAVAEMDEYVTERVPDSAVKLAWDALSDALQITYLVNATRTLDSVCEWIGDRYSRDQRLAWPRYNAEVDGYWIDNTTFPQLVKEATCEMAIWSMQNNGIVAVGQSAEFDSIKVGPITIDYNESATGNLSKYFPDTVPMLLRDLAFVSNPHLPSSKQMRVVRLMRA